MGQKGEGGYKLLAEADVFDGASSSSSINTKCIWRKAEEDHFAGLRESKKWSFTEIPCFLLDIR